MQDRVGDQLACDEDGIIDVISQLPRDEAGPDESAGRRHHLEAAFKVETIFQGITGRITGRITGPPKPGINRANRASIYPLLTSS